MLGYVRWYSIEKGYGYIKADDNQDVYVHFSDILSKDHKVLRKNEVVEFDIVYSFRGPRAKNVQKR